MQDSDKKLFVRIILISIALIFTSVILLLFFCISDSEICNAPDFQLIFGVIIGVVTTAAFFVFIERHQNRLDSKINDFLAGTYAVRTDMFNLFDVFGGKAHKIQPNEESRRKFVSQLEQHIKDFGLENDKIVFPIWKKAKDHENKIGNTLHNTKNCTVCKDMSENQIKHWESIFTHQASCEECKEIRKMIQEYLDKNKNPLQ